MTKVNTPYGELEESRLEEFCKVAGWKLKDNQWKIVSEEVEHWQIVNSTSESEKNKWKKKSGQLAIRDLNFQFAIAKTKNSAKGAKENSIVSINDVEKAIDYASEKLIDYQGNPIYLPEFLATKSGNYETDTKPPKLYSKILEETEKNIETLIT